MFELWLDTNPHATRKQVLDTLMEEAIEENTIAHKYDQELRKLYSPIPDKLYSLIPDSKLVLSPDLLTCESRSRVDFSQ